MEDRSNQRVDLNNMDSVPNIFSGNKLWFQIQKFYKDKDKDNKKHEMNQLKAEYLTKKKTNELSGLKIWSTELI